MESLLVVVVQVSVIVLAAWLALVAACGIIRIIGQLLEQPAFWALVVIGLIGGCAYFGR